MNEDTARGLVDMVMSRIEIEFKEEGEAMPQIFIMKGGKGTSLPLPWRDEDQKYALMDAMAHALRKFKPDLAIFVSECWMVKGDGDSMRNMQPREHPDRTDALMLVGQWDGGAIMISREVNTAEDGSRTLGEVVVSTEKGLMTSYARIFDGVFEDTIGSC